MRLRFSPSTSDTLSLSFFISFFWGCPKRVNELSRWRSKRWWAEKGKMTTLQRGVFSSTFSTLTPTVPSWKNGGFSRPKIFLSSQKACRFGWKFKKKAFSPRRLDQRAMDGVQQQEEPQQLSSSYSWESRRIELMRMYILSVYIYIMHGLLFIRRSASTPYAFRGFNSFSVSFSPQIPVRQWWWQDTARYHHPSYIPR